MLDYSMTEEYYDSFKQSPPMGQSLIRTKPGVWSLGTFMLCEEYTSKDFPYNSLAHWEDCGKRYCLRRRKIPITTRTPPDGDYNTGRFHNHDRDALWELSPNVFVKAKSWAPGITLEMDTITWVRHTFPGIPVVKAIYGWADPAWERSFLLTYRAKGEDLQTVWPRLSQSEKVDIVLDVTNIMNTMAAVTSETFRGIGGGLKWFPIIHIPKRDPSQKPRAPRPHPQYTAKEMDKQMDDYWSTIKINPKCKKFIFFHGDLSVLNVFVAPKGNGSRAHVTEIIDFELAGFYPSWYPLIEVRSLPYYFKTEENWRYEYVISLVRFLGRFPKDFPDESEWRKATEATDYGYSIRNARHEADDKEYKELQKGKDKVEEVGVGEVTKKVDDLKPWWEFGE